MTIGVLTIIYSYYSKLNTLFTSIKLQSGSKCTEILPKLDLTVFTYDSEDDFENNEYRGNSKYTMTINTN